MVFAFETTQQATKPDDEVLRFSFMSQDVRKSEWDTRTPGQ